MYAIQIFQSFDKYVHVIIIIIAREQLLDLSMIYQYLKQ